MKKIIRFILALAVIASLFWVGMKPKEAEPYISVLGFLASFLTTYKDETIRRNKQMFQLIGGILLITIGLVCLWNGGKLVYKSMGKTTKLKIAEKSELPSPDKKPLMIPSEISNKTKSVGILLEGKRNNIISADCNELIKSSHPNNVEVRQSLIAKGGLYESYITIEPDEIITLSLYGYPKAKRKDYTFSFIIYSDVSDIDLFDLTYSISDKFETSSENYDFGKSKDFTYIKSVDTKTYRPQISHYFSSIPKEVIGQIKLTNNSSATEKIAIFFPVIEEGLFASSPILCNEYRAGAFLSLDYSPEGIPQIAQKTNDDGTISFIFNIDWNSNRLTPGINPHFFYWTTPDQKNGIKVISDSEDNGKIKLISIKDGLITSLSSDISPMSGETYSFDLRFNGSKADLIINGSNLTSSDKIAFPDLLGLSGTIYLGCSPESEDLSVFGTMRNFRIYENWLDDRTIKTELMKIDPKRFTFPLSTK